MNDLSRHLARTAFASGNRRRPRRARLLGAGGRAGAPRPPGGLLAGRPPGRPWLVRRFLVTAAEARCRRPPEGASLPADGVGERFAAAFAALAVACFLSALALAGPELLVPLLAALPLAVTFLFYDLRPGRSWQAELAAPAAFASSCAAMVVASGWTLPAALLCGRR